MSDAPLDSPMHTVDVYVRYHGKTDVLKHIQYAPPDSISFHMLREWALRAVVEYMPHYSRHSHQITIEVRI